MPLKTHQFKHLVSILPDIHVFKIQLRSFASILEVCLTSLEPGFQCTQPPNQVVNAHLSSSHPLLMHRHLPVPTGNRILVCHTVPRLLFLLHPLKTNYPPLNFQATPMQRTQTTSYNRLYQTTSYSKPATELVIDHLPPSCYVTPKLRNQMKGYNKLPQSQPVKHETRKSLAKLTK